MNLVLVTGGVRGGKSTYAQQRAAALGGHAVTVLATAEPVDDEMRRRIAAHRRDRPHGWVTLEYPLHVEHGVRDAETPVIVLDCFTVYTANVLGQARPTSELVALDATHAAVEALLDAITARAQGTLIVVTNEVGFAVHPPTALGRWYSDCLGTANQRLAAAADEVVLLVAGVPVPIKGGAA